MDQTQLAENAVYVDESQFQSGHSTMKCGFYAVWQNHFAGQPGHQARGTGADIEAKADASYVADDGADVASNESGMSLPQLYDLIHTAGDHWQNLYPDALAISDGDLREICRQWLHLGYTIIVAVDEASVHDQDLGACPYSWNPAPGQFSHIITLSGLQPNGVDFLARDTASIAPEGIRPGPRKYASTPLKIWSATLYIHDWQQRPAGPRPPAQPPTPAPAPSPAPNPVPTPAPSTNWKAQALAAVAALQEALPHLS